MLRRIDFIYMRVCFSLVALMILLGCSGSSDSGSVPVDDSTWVVPNISAFQSSKTDQFLMNLDHITDGHAYRGIRSETSSPHSGAHLNIINDQNQWPQGGSSPEHYPPIYAIADAEVTRIDTYFSVVQQPQGIENFRYGITLKIAEREGAPVTFSYSIEPMINPDDDDFYKPFILVEVGDIVEKGDVIAYFYLAPNDDSHNAHIHFHMQWNNQFQGPCIFTEELVSSFNVLFQERGYEGDSAPGTMCYMLGENENPFEERAVDLL